MEAFQLRLWDGRIGRWLSPDPYGEFHSPYLGMGNNPISMIDPDGGCTKCPGDGKKHVDGMPGSGTSQQLDEIVIQGYKKPDGFFAKGASAISTPDMFRFNGYNFGYNYTGNDKNNSFNLKISGFNYEHFNNSDKWGLDLSVKASALEGKASIKGGNSIFTVSSTNEGCIGCADASFKTKTLVGNQGKYGFDVKVGAGFYGARVKNTNGINILGASINWKVGASAYTANIAMHGHFYYDDKKETIEFGQLASLGLGIGALEGLSGSIPVGWLFK